MTKHSLAVLVAWFGEWPPWINLFIESCRWNSSIRWILFSDQPPPENGAPNVMHERVSFRDYCLSIADALETTIGAQSPYKLCDLRPALPFVHAAMLSDFDFVATGDLDVIYGDIRSFYDDGILASCDLFSTHPDRISGHFCVMRNQEEVIGAFRRVPGWRKVFAQPENIGFDERALYNLVRGKRRFLGAPMREAIRCYFHEQHTTPAATDRMRWYWREGRLTNEFYPHHPFMYLHFMSWHSSRWLANQPDWPPNAPAPWDGIEDLVRLDWRIAAKEGFTISPEGFTAIERRR